MKLLTTAAMALALTGAAAIANAQQPGGDQHKDKQSQQHGQGGGAGQQHGQAGQPQIQRGPPGGQRNVAGPPGGQHFNGQVQQYNGQRGGPGAGGQANGQVQQGYSRYRGGPGAGGSGAGGPGAGGQAGQRGAGFAGRPGVRPGLGFQSHGLRPQDQGRVQFTAGAFARQYQAQRRFRFGGYRSWPAGWYFNSWNYGDFLPYGWFASQYYIDWGDYGLPPPPIGCEWIAQGPDALLVDIWTGEVLSVYRGVFYWNGY